MVVVSVSPTRAGPECISFDSLCNRGDGFRSAPMTGLLSQTSISKLPFLSNPQLFCVVLTVAAS